MKSLFKDLCCFDHIWLIHNTCNQKQGNSIKNTRKNIISLYLNVQPHSFEIRKTLQGKPYCKDTPFYFNTSHTKNYCVLVFSMHPIGIDIEEKSEKIYFTQELLNLTLTQKEQEYVKTSMDFLTFWVRKEALLKALGCGLYKDPKKIEVLADIYQEEGLWYITDTYINEDLISTRVTKNVRKEYKLFSLLIKRR